jgi:hypothetical protein
VFTIQDATGGITIETTVTHCGPGPGSTLRVIGTTGTDGVRPIVKATQVRFSDGNHSLKDLAARPVHGEPKDLEDQWVEAVGGVQRVELETGQRYAVFSRHRQPHAQTDQPQPYRPRSQVCR